MTRTPLFTNQDTAAATEAAPIVSDAFECEGPFDPITLASEDLDWQNRDSIEVRQYSTVKDDYVRFSSRGQSGMDYNDTNMMIYATGTYKLYITKPTLTTVSAEMRK